MRCTEWGRSGCMPHLRMAHQASGRPLRGRQSLRCNAFRSPFGSMLAGGVRPSNKGCCAGYRVSRKLLMHGIDCDTSATLQEEIRRLQALVGEATAGKQTSSAGADQATQSPSVATDAPKKDAAGGAADGRHLETQKPPPSPTQDAVPAEDVEDHPSDPPATAELAAQLAAAKSDCSLLGSQLEVSARPDQARHEEAAEAHLTATAYLLVESIAKLQAHLALCCCVKGSLPGAADGDGGTSGLPGGAHAATGRAQGAHRAPPPH